MKNLSAVQLLAVLVISLRAEAVTVSVDKSRLYQTIDGFGAYMAIEPWKIKQGPFYVNVDLNAVGFYDTVISQLAPTIIRVFADPEFERDSGQFVVTSGTEFSMRTQFNHIRNLRAAASRQREPLEFIMSVLSPPAYMKVSGKVQGEIEAAPNYYSTDCRLKDGYDDEFARYLVRYLQVQKDSTGMDVWALNIQNEPAFQEPYASCVYNGLRYTSVSAVVGAALAQAGLPTRLFGAEHMAWAFPNAFETYVRNSPEARIYFKAWAVHGYQDGVRADTGAYQGETPTDKPLWMTETSGSIYGATTGGLRDWGGAMTLARHILGFLRSARASAWLYYTLMSVSPLGDYSNTYGLYADGAPTDKAYASHHFYRYIRPGARQIASSSSDNQVQVVAFWHEQNSCMTIVVINSASAAATLDPLTGTGLPSQWEVVTSTGSEKLVRSTVQASQAIVLPPASITTLVSGEYRATLPVAVAPEHTPATGSLLSHRATSVQAYALDGRRVGGLSGRKGSPATFPIVIVRSSSTMIKSCEVVFPR